MTGTLLPCPALTIKNPVALHVSNVMHPAQNPAGVDVFICANQINTYEGWKFNIGNYLFTTDTK